MKRKDFPFNSGDKIYAETKDKSEWIIGIISPYGICTQDNHEAGLEEEISYIIIICGGWATINDVMFSLSINPEKYNIHLLKIV